MLGFPLLYFKGRTRMMFQLSSFYCKVLRCLGYRVEVSEYRVGAFRFRV